MIRIDKLELEAKDFLEIMKSFKTNKEAAQSLVDEEVHELNEEVEKEKKPINVVKFPIDPDADIEELEESIDGVLKHMNNGNKIKLQSNFARYNAIWIAACASQGFISSIDEDGNLTDRWSLTVKGLKFIREEEED